MLLENAYFFWMEPDWVYFYKNLHNKVLFYSVCSAVKNDFEELNKKCLSERKLVKNVKLKFQNSAQLYLGVSLIRSVFLFL